MSGNSLLLDTNIILYLLAGDSTIARFLNQKQLYISFITELELLGYKEIFKEDKEKMINFINECIIVDINSPIKKEVINIQTMYKIKLPDAIIAATSVYLNLPLVSADKQFNRILQLNTIEYQPS